MERKKVAIIGGGICGLYLGGKLAEKNHNVTIFERKRKIGKNSCSGLFSHRIFHFIPKSQQFIENYLENAVLHFPKKDLKIKFSKNIFAINRVKLDNLLSKDAQIAGAKIILGKNLKGIPSGFDKVIGCDGGLSMVRKSLGLKNPVFRLGLKGFLEKPSFSHSLEIWVLKRGFLWKIPRGGRIEYGIIDAVEKAKNNFKSFLSKNNISLDKIRGSIIPQGLIVPSNNSITTCGDAVGLTKPWSGGGVIWSLKGCEIFLKSFPNLLVYEKTLKRYFYPRIALLKTITRAVYFLGYHFPFLLPSVYNIDNDFLFKHHPKDHYETFDESPLNGGE